MPCLFHVFIHTNQQLQYQYFEIIDECEKISSIESFPHYLNENVRFVKNSCYTVVTVSELDINFTVDKN